MNQGMSWQTDTLTGHNVLKSKKTKKKQKKKPYNCFLSNRRQITLNLEIVFPFLVKENMSLQCKITQAVSR